jgi:hypothetical protein
VVISSIGEKGDGNLGLVAQSSGIEGLIAPIVVVAVVEGLGKEARERRDEGESSIICS